MIRKATLVSLVGTLMLIAAPASASHPEENSERRASASETQAPKQESSRERVRVGFIRDWDRQIRFADNAGSARVDAAQTRIASHRSHAGCGTATLRSYQDPDDCQGHPGVFFAIGW